MKSLFKFVGFLSVLLLFGTTLSSCIEPIDAGNVGIKFNKAGSDRGVSNVEEVSGWVWYNPVTTRIVEIPVTSETVKYTEIPIKPHGGVGWTAEPILNYHIDPAKASDVYVRFRRPLGEIETGYMYSTMLKACRDAADGFTSDSLLNDQPGYESSVRLLLEKQLNPLGFVIEQVSANLQIPKGLIERINAKNESIQNAELARNQAVQAFEHAKVVRAAAQGVGDSIRTMADARAYANQKEQSTLTPLLIQQQWIKKWDGALPTYQTGSGQGLMLNFGKQ